MINKWIKIGGFGILLWIIPFIVSFLIFPLREGNRIFFEAIMPVILTLAVLTFSVLYYKQAFSNYLNEGILVSLIWFMISIVFDLILFLPDSHMQMTIDAYFMDIGFTYLIILIIPIMIGYLLDTKKSPKS